MGSNLECLRKKHNVFTVENRSLGLNLLGIFFWFYGATIRKRAYMLLHIVDGGRGRQVWAFGVQDLVAWDKPRWKATGGKNI